MIAKDLMPWLFINRKAQWRPFAKVRCEDQKLEDRRIQKEADE